MGTFGIRMQKKTYRNHLSFTHEFRLSSIQMSNKTCKTDCFGAIRFDSCGAIRFDKHTERKWESKLLISYWQCTPSATCYSRSSHLHSVESSFHFAFIQQQKHTRKHKNQNSSDSILIVHSQYMDMYVLLMDVVYNRKKSFQSQQNGIRLNHSEHLI